MNESAIKRLKHALSISQNRHKYDVSNGARGKEMTRRVFVKGLTASIFAVLAGCAKPPTEQRGINDTGLTSGETEAWGGGDVPTIDREVVSSQPFIGWKDYRSVTQTIGLNAAGQVVECTPVPVSGEEQKGVELTYGGYEWQVDTLHRVDINGGSYPVLTSSEYIFKPESLEAWHSNPNYVQEWLNTIPDADHSTPISVTVIAHILPKDEYYEQDAEGSCELVRSENRPTHAPNDLADQLVAVLQQKFPFYPISIDARVQTDRTMIPFSTKELDPDQSNAPAGLYEAYGQVVDYTAIASVIKSRGTNTAFVFSAPSAGMYETARWGEEMIFGFNYDHPLVDALHSVTHHLENRFKNIFVLSDGIEDLYNLMSGRSEDTYLPYSDISQTNYDQIIAAGTIFAAAGYGTIHFPPNALTHYHYDSMIPVILPGETRPITSEVWDKTQEGYLLWWMEKMAPLIKKRTFS